MRPVEKVPILPLVGAPRVSNASSGRLALQILTGATLGVTAAFVAARCNSNSITAHLLDYLHWTIAYVAAAALAWLGVRCSDGHVRIARRWFAFGLTATAL